MYWIFYFWVFDCSGGPGVDLAAFEFAALPVELFGIRPRLSVMD